MKVGELVSIKVDQLSSKETFAVVPSHKTVIDTLVINFVRLILIQMTLTVLNAVHTS